MVRQSNHQSQRRQPQPDRIRPCRRRPTDPSPKRAFDPKLSWSSSEQSRSSRLLTAVATVLLTRHDNPTKVATSSTKSITLTGHTDTVQSAAFNPDGTEIAIASGDSTVIIWDVATGKQLDTLTGHADLVRSLDARSRVAAGRPRSCGGERREYGDDPKPPTGSVVGDQGGDLR